MSLNNNELCSTFSSQNWVNFSCIIPNIVILNKIECIYYSKDYLCGKLFISFFHYSPLWLNIFKPNTILCSYPSWQSSSKLHYRKLFAFLKNDNFVHRRMISLESNYSEMYRCTSSVFFWAFLKWCDKDQRKKKKKRVQAIEAA